MKHYVDMLPCLTDFNANFWPNNVDYDQTPQNAASDQGQHYSEQLLDASTDSIWTY